MISLGFVADKFSLMALLHLPENPFQCLPPCSRVDFKASRRHMSKERRREGGRKGRMKQAARGEAENSAYFGIRRQVCLTHNNRDLLLLRAFLWLFASAIASLMIVNMHGVCNRRSGAATNACLAC